MPASKQQATILRKSSGLVTTSYVAKRCGVTPASVLRWCADPKVKTEKICGRVYIRLHSLLRARPDLKIVFAATDSEAE